MGPYEKLLKWNRLSDSEKEELRRMKRFSAIRCRDGELPESIGELDNLEILLFRSNEIKRVPWSIGNLFNLKKLDLSSNRIRKLPKSIGNLVNLEELLLNCNKLEKLPKYVGNLFNLKRLVLSFNRIRKVPKSIGNLFHLEDLILTYNPLRELPESMRNLANLKALDLFGCHLKELPLCVGAIEGLECVSSGCGWDNQVYRIKKLFACRFQNFNTENFRAYDFKFRTAITMISILLRANNCENILQMLPNELAVLLFDSLLCENYRKY